MSQHHLRGRGPEPGFIRQAASLLTSTFVCPQQIPLILNRLQAWELIPNPDLLLGEHSASQQVRSATKQARVPLQPGSQPLQGGTDAFQACLPGPARGRGHSRWLQSAEQLFGIRCEPRASMRASANPPISPSRTETAGAFQELDLMRLYHRGGVEPCQKGVSSGKI